MALSELPSPSAGLGEVIIAVDLCGLCGSDSHIWHGDPSSSWIEVGTVLGHEVVGRVVEIGAEVTTVALGDRVTPMSIFGCGECDLCDRGLGQLCKKREWLGLSRNGGLATTVAVPARTLLHVGSLPDETAVLTEPMSVACRAVLTRGRLSPDDHVVISGPGAIGLLAGIAARHAGAQVTVVGTPDDVVNRAGICELVGLHLTAEPPRGVDLWIEAAGAAPALNNAVRAMSRGGRIVLVGIYGAPVTVDVDDAIRKEVSVLASYSGDAQDYRTALDVLHTVPNLGAAFVHTVPMTSALSALASIGSGERPKHAVRPRR